MMISPSYPNTKLDEPSVADLIDVFEDRIRLWVLAPAQRLLEMRHGQAAGFGLALSYIEGIWSYIEGGSPRWPKEFFSKAFVDVFRATEVKEVLLLRIAAMLADARWGFLHDAMLRDRISFASLPQGEMLVTLPTREGRIDEEGDVQSLIIDPDRFHSAVERHFDQFVAVIRDSNNAEARTKFVTCFKHQTGFKDPQSAKSLTPTTAAA
jgi:hypothetical protein